MQVTMVYVVIKDMLESINESIYKEFEIDLQYMYFSEISKVFL
jgi:hypothetical protein